MSVNMAGFYKNPFRVGDKVKVNATALRAFPDAFKNYLSVRYVVVTKIDGPTVFTDVDNRPTYFEHFTLYKEPEEDVMKKPDTQQKTKRTPFTHELWEKHKDVAKIIYIPSGGEVLGFAYFPEADSRFHYAYLTRSGTAPTFGSGESFWLEVPVTTKRIPFNPELKDAKVVCRHTSDELLEWVYMMSGVVCGVIKHEGGGYTTKLYHPNTLEMEIEEDV